VNFSEIQVKRHTCDRKGPPAKVIDESGDEPITCIYPTCSVRGVPQVFTSGMRTEQLIAKIEGRSLETRELIARLVELLATVAQRTDVEDVRRRLSAMIADLEKPR
jgi:hypothetical protein